MGNILSVKKATRTTANSSKTEHGAYSAYRSYEYDNLYQLTRENNKSTGETTVWAYDELGNITSAKTYTYTTNDSPGTATKTVKYRYGNDGKSGWNNLLTGVDLSGNNYFGTTETITYDEIGNPLTYLGATLTWRGRSLSSYSEGDLDVTYSYGADGLRTIKTVDGKKNVYIYSGDLLAYQCTYTASGAIDYEIYFFYDSYGYYKGMKYVNASGVSTYFYAVTNAQGDVLALYNGAGKLRATYEYDAWGNQIVKGVTQDEDDNNLYTDLTDNPTGSYFANLNPIRYRGYYFDSETGLYYLQSRYYNPLVGRFLNADGYITTNVTEPLTYNMFAYCGNNPVMFSDPSGESLTALAIGLAVLLSIGIAHWLDKNEPDGYTYKTLYEEKIGNETIKGDLFTAEGNGASIDKNGVSIGSIDASVINNSITTDDKFSESNLNLLSVEGYASIDYSGEFNGGAEFAASLLTVKSSQIYDFGYYTAEVSVSLYFGSVSGGVAWDTQTGSFKVNSPTIGIGGGFGIDYDYK